MYQTIIKKLLILFIQFLYQCNWLCINMRRKTAIFSRLWLIFDDAPIYVIISAISSSAIYKKPTLSH